jgi:hypothetical protein
MSTRGFLGFVIDGTEKIAYNHCDSYPEYLGIHVLQWVRANGHALAHDAILRDRIGGPVDLIRQLRVVEDGSDPTDADIERLAPYTNRNVGGRTSRPEWYQLLRETQGDPGAILTAGVVIDGSSFPTDSLFAEFGYIVDLDAGTFEAYRGFQHEPHDQGRFAGRARADRDGYYPCALVASWPIGALPADDELIAAFGGNEDD